MARQVTQYDLLISCPSDIQSEIALINKAVDEFNTLFSDTLGISIRTKHWSKNAFAQSGDKPQSILNEQFVNDCDAAVAVFWTRFGTPTVEYGSGTEEEIEIMLKSDKQVFMYFSDKPVSPSQHNASEYARIQAFREKYKNRGLYFNYSTDDEFYKLFFPHLTQYFLAEKRVAEVIAERVPNLSLHGIDNEGKLSKTAKYQPFRLHTQKTFKGEFDEIKELIHDISNIKFQGPPASSGGLSSAFNTPVKVKESWVEIIKSTAEALHESLPKDFFNLGKLSKDNLSPPEILGGTKYIGSSEEKRKYNLIQQLHKKIIEACTWAEAEDCFNNLMCVKLSLTNYGTAADDEIDITIRIPRRLYLSPEEFPKLSDNTMRYLTRDCNLNDLLSIHSTSEYSDYDSSLTVQTQVSSPRPSPILFGSADYLEDYTNELEEIFCYEVYESGDDCVIKLRVDHLKHHMAVAFPTALFLKDKPDAINYTITSRNAAQVITGQIIVE